MSRNKADGLTEGQLKAKGFYKLRKSGIAQAIVHYSGGNDDGGSEGITTIMEDGTTGEIKEHYLRGEYIVGKGYVTPNDYPEEVREEAHLADILVAPVYRLWGTFAGDFYVSGEVTWDTKTEKITVNQDYQEPSHSHQELDW